MIKGYRQTREYGQGMQIDQRIFSRDVGRPQNIGKGCRLAENMVKGSRLGICRQRILDRLANWKKCTWKPGRRMATRILIPIFCRCLHKYVIPLSCVHSACNYAKLCSQARDAYCLQSCRLAISWQFSLLSNRQSWAQLLLKALNS